MEFTPFPKIPRLFRDITITEKIDGTNAAIAFEADGTAHAQSRNRIITPEDDNYGFAKWVQDNSLMLWHDLGPGVHFGEWWGSGIYRGYGAPNGQKYFSLFNTYRWAEKFGPNLGAELGTVPVLYRGPFDWFEINAALDVLREHGSKAAPGFDRPEGIVIHHRAGNHLFKVSLDDDQLAKEELKNVD
jgi:hypothetical protein